MGTDAHLVSLGDPDHVRPALDLALRALADLEARWSRFRPDSELARLNAGAGTAVRVSQPTVALVALAVEAWRATAGRFDPTVLPALCRLGYDRTFDAVEASGTPLVDGGPDPAPGCDGIEVDPERSTVLVPEGVALDLGGVGKGRAADLVVDLLLRCGAEGACVDLGGDVRVAGRPPDEHGWVLGVADPWDPDVDLAVLALGDGAVVTSARTRRRWWFDGTEQHHLIDPVTGLPARSGLASVTVVAAEAVWAEVVAKAAFVAGPIGGAATVVASGAAGLLVDDDRRVQRVGSLELYECEWRFPA